MPLVRLEVRNEYRLGQNELCRETNKEDPKAVLDGVAVAGLVGILRQLGDLAEFAAEVFHGLQEQVTTTASRSHKLMVRVKHIEAAMPPLEKAVLAQTSHIHFAYTAGSEWHPRIRNEQNHFIYNDLPRFIMDSYEECQDPPRLHLLDKFDTGGPGSCLKRYSDPTFFRRVVGDFKEQDADKVHKDKKSRKSKKKRASQRKGDLLHTASLSNLSGRMHFTPVANGKNSPSLTGSTIDMTMKSDLEEHSNSFDSRPGSGHVECVFHLSSSAPHEEQDYKDISSQYMHHNDAQSFPDEQSDTMEDHFMRSSSPEKIAPSSSCVTWDEKEELVEHEVQHCGEEETLDVLTTYSYPDAQERRSSNNGSPDQMDLVFEVDNTPQFSVNRNQVDEVESETDNFVDALNTIESESETDYDCHTKHEVEQFSSKAINEVVEDGAVEVTPQISDGHSPQVVNDQCHEVECETSSDLDTCSNKELPEDTSDSVSLMGINDEQKVNNSTKVSIIDHSIRPESTSSADLKPEGTQSADLRPEDTASTDAFDVPRVSVVSGPSASVSESLISTEPVTATINGPVVHQEPLDELPGVHSVGSFDHQEPQNEYSGSAPVSFEHPEPQVESSSVLSVSPYQESQNEVTSVQPVTFWTNGGLLGLQPSKPPDFASSNAVSQDSVTRSRGVTVGPQNSSSVSCSSDERAKPGYMIRESAERILNSKRADSWHENQEMIVQKSCQSNHSMRSGDGHGIGLNRISESIPGNELPVDEDAKALSVEAKQENEENSQLFGLGQRLLSNGFHRKMPNLPDTTPELSSALTACVLEEKNGNHSVTQQATAEKESYRPFEHRSNLDSITSSPPLEQMKMSFHPMDSFEISKLKLKFPDRSNSSESIREMFTSFQLVPESAVPLDDVVSDSDDDTFCRSSPYMSDDCPSQNSETDSEQWESGETPESKDQELYDALRRISSSEPVSSSLQPGDICNSEVPFGVRKLNAMNIPDPALSDSLLDFPSFDAVNPAPPEGALNNSSPKDLQGSTPLPPPLPPVQWRHLKHHSDISEDKQHITSEAFEHELNLKLLEASLSQQRLSAPAREQQDHEQAISVQPVSKQQDEQKSQHNDNQLSNLKKIDEKEDFLQQIRAKSFNLRRTVTAKPTFSSGHHASYKVTAILQKANAIRQVVGSDDDEDDDTWSDT